MLVQEVKSFHLWMASLDIIKSKLNWKTNIKQLLFILGVPSHTRKFPLDWKMSGKLFSGQWIFLFMILRPLLNPTLMICLHIIVRGSITQITCIWFLNDADTTKFSWIPTSVFLCQVRETARIHYFQQRHSGGAFESWARHKSSSSSFYQEASKPAGELQII